MRYSKSKALTEQLTAPPPPWPPPCGEAWDLRLRDHIRIHNFKVSNTHLIIKWGCIRQQLQIKNCWGNTLFLGLYLGVMQKGLLSNKALVRTRKLWLFYSIQFISHPYQDFHWTYIQNLLAPSWFLFKLIVLFKKCLESFLAFNLHEPF